jgi:hypothetical protein
MLTLVSSLSSLSSEPYLMKSSYQIVFYFVSTQLYFFGYNYFILFYFIFLSQYIICSFKRHQQTFAFCSTDWFCGWKFVCVWNYKMSYIDAKDIHWSTNNRKTNLLYQYQYDLGWYSLTIGWQSIPSDVKTR